MRSNSLKSYSELSKLPTLLERYEYLKLSGQVGSETFGYDRYLNQSFYHSSEWKMIRQLVIYRDGGCEMGLNGYEIQGMIIVHHINPIMPFDMGEPNSYLTDLDNLVCVSEELHKAIHYGDDSILKKYALPPERKPGDTSPWLGG